MDDLQEFHGPNAGYLLDMYERFRSDPAAVDTDTRAFFERIIASYGSDALEEAALAAEDTAPVTADDDVAAATPPPAPASTAARAAPPADTNGSGSNGATHPTAPNGTHAPATASEPNGRTTFIGGYRPASTGAPDSFPLQATNGVVIDFPDVVNAARLVRFIREIGHLAARVDPLGNPPPGDPALELTPQGLTRELLEAMPPSVVMSPLAEGCANAYEAIERLREVYSGTIGYDDDQVQTHNERQWMRQAAEDRRFFAGIDDDYKRMLLERLIDVEVFERFLHTTFVGQKRFSVEGTDMVIPMLDSIIHDAAVAGTHEIVIGMAHRGRLNVLAHTLGKPYSAILAEFQGPANIHNRATYAGWKGDVKYHLGARKAYREGGEYEMPVTLVPNPSHLEFVNPVVQGRARAAQEGRAEPGCPGHDPRITLPILIHGDASFPGQGIVAETLNMSRLAGYHTGGTIHIILNNQIGFTTEAGDSRSTLYAGDLAKGFEMPVMHVNADDPVACIAAVRLAWAYRERYSKDIIIDLIGYRRWGHNEGDEPSYTQPRMYEQVVQHPTVRELFANRLIEEGIVTNNDVQARMQLVEERLRRALHEVENRGRVEATVAMSASAIFNPPVRQPEPVSLEQLKHINEGLTTLPDGFKLHPKLGRWIQKRRDGFGAGHMVDWAHAEALAFGSILREGTPIRMTGQDAERGTFSQRHLVLHHFETGERFTPLQALPQAQASFAVYNSPLSEAGVLGFEYGFSIHAPETLVLWEAQFGDFSNGGQVIIDQFLVSGFAKWGQQPSLVMLLPHGYEGQGPEHSSARLERFLQLAADNNIRVVNCTTAAQYFHLLRRQATLLQADPRPLVVMTPKSLLRHPMASSPVENFTSGRFLPVLIPALRRETADAVTRLILCSGKVYVDLMMKIEAGELTMPESAVVARVEELYPFPTNELQGLVGWYRNLEEVVWLQEEPANMGAWTYMFPRLRELLDSQMHLPYLKDVPIRYVGRSESATTAEGGHLQHKEEQARILRNVVEGVFEQHHARI